MGKVTKKGYEQAIAIAMGLLTSCTYELAIALWVGTKISLHYSIFSTSFVDAFRVTFGVSAILIFLFVVGVAMYVLSKYEETIREEKERKKK